MLEDLKRHSLNIYNESEIEELIRELIRALKSENENIKRPIYAEISQLQRMKHELPLSNRG